MSWHTQGGSFARQVAKAFTEELFPQAGNIEPVRLRQVRLDRSRGRIAFPWIQQTVSTVCA